MMKLSHFVRSVSTALFYLLRIRSIFCDVVGFPDFPGQKWRTHGDTYEMAVSNGVEALESLIIAYAASGELLPEPKTICV